TGDYTFERILRLGGPLVKENIATMVVLESVVQLLCVTDFLQLGRATIEEARSLLHWLDFEAGFGKMGVLN
ncbi:DUF2048 family protein, partial [Medicago truncatula]